MSSSTTKDEGLRRRSRENTNRRPSSLGLGQLLESVGTHLVDFLSWHGLQLLQHSRDQCRIELLLECACVVAIVSISAGCDLS